MVRRIRLNRKRQGKRTRGQAVVEFALVSFFMLMLILGILEAGRLMLAFSVVSNSAQEGSWYGIVRPRDVMTLSEAQARRARGTPVPTQIVVANGNCNVVDKAKDKVWGVPRDEVDVRVWYDAGRGTPTVVTAGNINSVVHSGNRIVVESSYRFRFIVPILERLAPNGIDVKMRSARTLLSNGDGARPPCAFEYELAPTPDVAATRTAQVYATQTARAAATATPTATVPPTLALVVSILDARKDDGNNRPLYVKVQITDNAVPPVPVAGAIVNARIYNCSVTPCADLGARRLTDMGSGFYQLCPVGNYSGNAANMGINVDATLDPYTPANAWRGGASSPGVCPP
jgi:hypothetical protein